MAKRGEAKGENAKGKKVYRVHFDRVATTGEGLRVCCVTAF